MYKVTQYNSITNKNGIVRYDTSIIKIVPTYEKAIEIAFTLKRKTGKLYKIKRVV